jgi:hypothetical protein
METLTLPDGRVLEYLVEGPATAIPLVLHHGTPSGTVRYAPLVDAALAGGFRFVQASRPGYATSTPHPGRRVADVAADTAGADGRPGRPGVRRGRLVRRRPARPGLRRACSRGAAARRRRSPASRRTTRRS